MIDFGYFLSLIGLGAAGGFLAGLLGIGGGMVLVPFMTVLLSDIGVAPEVVVKMAIATSLSTIFFTSMSSIYTHHRSGYVRWDIAKVLVPAVASGSLIGSAVASTLQSTWLALAFFAIVSVSAVQMLLNRNPKSNRNLPKGTGLFGAGASIGFVAGIVGAGGGFLTVPFLTWCNTKIHNAVATSATLGFPIALFGSIGYVVSGWSDPDLPSHAVGYLHWPSTLGIVVASVLTAPVGAKTAHRLNTGPLKRAFGVVLLALAASMAYQATKGL